MVYIPLLIGLFLVIFFIVALVLSASTWRGWHITVVCLTFLALIGLVIVGSMTHRTHTTWKEKFAQVSAQLVTEKATTVQLQIGDPLLVEPDEPALLDLQQQLDELLLSRGRVWRRCSATNPPQNSRIPISTVPLNEDGTPGDPNLATENGMNTNMVVYGFREAAVPTTEGGQAFVPIAFLGEFLVVDAQPTIVTLQPTLPLDGQQASLVGDLSASWALYEMMPLDNHQAFCKGARSVQQLDNTVEQPIFGEMDEQELRQIFAATTGLPVDDQNVSRLVQPYVKDGYAASEEDVNAYQTSIWQKVEFLKDAQGEAVNSPDPVMGVDGDYFDKSGRAVAARLRLEGDVTFRNNDIGVFPYGHDTDKARVDQRVADGTIQKITPIFVRPLHDYEESFHNIQRRFIARNEDVLRAQRDTANLQLAREKTLGQIAYRQEERQKLKDDQTGFQRDNDKMDQLLKELNELQTTLTAELRELYRNNLGLSHELTVCSQKLAEILEQRASSVAVQ